jgi:hypothetical protein
MPLVTLETLFDPMAAEIMRMRLEAGGIEAVFCALAVHEQIAPPTRTGTEDRANIGDLYAITISVTWSRQP